MNEELNKVIEAVNDLSDSMREAARKCDEAVNAFANFQEALEAAGYLEDEE